MLTSSAYWDYQLSQRLTPQELMSSMRNWSPIIIQTLESMGKKKDIRGYLTLTQDKLLGIRADLVKLDDN